MPKPSITQIEIGTRLRERRKQLGLTIADVAHRMGENVGGSTVQRIEVGTQNPTLATFFAHCEAVDLSPATVMDGSIPLSVRPTVQEALRVIAEHIEMTGVIIKKDHKFTREIADMDEDERESVLEAIRLIKAGRSSAKGFKKAKQSEDESAS